MRAKIEHMPLGVAMLALGVSVASVAIARRSATQSDRVARYEKRTRYVAQYTQNRLQFNELQRALRSLVDTNDVAELTPAFRELSALYDEYDEVLQQLHAEQIPQERWEGWQACLEDTALQQKDIKIRLERIDSIRTRPERVASKERVGDVVGPAPEN